MGAMFLLIKDDKDYILKRMDGTLIPDAIKGGDGLHYRCQY